MHGVEWPVLILLAAPIYFAPLIIAGVRHHSKLFPIVLVNVFLGGTIIGWLVSLIWAFTDNIPPENKDENLPDSSVGVPLFQRCPYYADIPGGEAPPCKFYSREIAAEQNTEEPEEEIEKTDLQTDWFEQPNQFFLRNGAYEDAVVALSSAIDADTTDASLYFFRAAAYSKLHENQRALDDLEKSAELGYKKAIEQLFLVRRTPKLP